MEQNGVIFNSVVDHPKHYISGGIEAIEVIEAWDLGFNLGNVIKYICRNGKKSKNRLIDLEKAAWYLNREIDNLKKENENNG